MSLEFLLLLNGKSSIVTTTTGLIDAYAIIQSGACKVGTIGMKGNGWHGMHGRIGNVLDGNANIPFPNEYLLIVGAGDHDHGGTLFFRFDEGDGVDGCEMVIVFLVHESRGTIVGDDFVIGTAGDKVIIVFGIELQYVGNASICECLEYGTGFGIP